METRLTQEEQRPPRARTRRNWAPWLVLAGAGAVLVAAITAFVMLAMPSDPARHPLAKPQKPRALDLPFDPNSLTVADPAQLKAVTPEQAALLNAAIPISRLPNPPAKPFILPLRDLANFGRALQCLTQAVYYEAATEPVEGQRAVAQVVLNRVRHPAYPATVCGVVYEGSERPTGCQFTFTCDGALARPPVPALWARARMIATSALAGSVYAPVGMATNYHADYVVPNWAGLLTKLTVVGRHIFYRLPGWPGTPAAFVDRYAGNEPAVGTPVAEVGEVDGNVTDVAPATAPMAARPVLDAANGMAVGGATAAPGAVPGAAGASSPAAGPASRRPGRWILSRDEPPPAAPAGASNPVPGPRAADPAHATAQPTAPKN